MKENETLKKGVSECADCFEANELVLKAAIIDARIEGNKDVEQSYQEIAKSVNLNSIAMLVHAVVDDQVDGI